MQYIYAFETSQLSDIKHFEKNLLLCLNNVKDQYLYLLLYIREIANYVEKDASIKDAKFIKSPAHNSVNTKLLSNFLIQFLNHDEPFLKEIKSANTAALIDIDEHIRPLYKLLIETKEYKDYIHHQQEFDIDEDRKIIGFILNQILFTNDIFLERSEEHFTNWNDDAEFVVEAVNEVINKSKHELKLHLNRENIKNKIAELTEFGLALFSKTIENRKTDSAFIEPCLKNWDSDRLATVDIILMRMALTEFMHFPNIPLKVTINEYLDIAKEYSTPKSKDFINGVLDSIMKDLKEKNLIQKTGRGLL